MTNNTWRRGQKHSYTDRPLTDKERLFAEEKHNFIYTYMRIRHLDIEEWYDILVIPYLNSVKKYFEDEDAQQHSFESVSFMKLETAVMNHYRAMHRKKRMPEGGVISLNITLEGDNPFSENTPDEWYIDSKASTEKVQWLYIFWNKFSVC